jgi:pimeloyl-ACP methyl ester carboxylesterase
MDYLKKELSDEFRLIVWNLPGLGRSTRPTNRDYSLENLSRHLEAVLARFAEAIAEEGFIFGLPVAGPDWKCERPQAALRKFPL